MIAQALIDAARTLSAALAELRFAAPVALVYNPLQYARAAHETYLRRFGDARKRVVMLGMNPGPFGMMQTGVPFGEVAAVRDWMGITAPIDRPGREHPKRPIQGFDCPRSEVSGRRLWGWARERFGTPERFFADYLVLNYCPLVFLEASGRNRTPEQLPAAELAPLVAACDRHLERALALLAPELAVGIGGFAERRLRAVIGDRKPPRIGAILHPSPASPAANRGWQAQAERQLAALGAPLP
ncbi:MAG: single-stranded DNA-binding protein [Burkholderiales bacterium]|nr:MAG: single-stranded DNA-binding protein [Burkholderiales bacterium]